MRILPKITAPSDQQERKLKEKVLRENALMGGKLFGPVPKGHQRQFFCLDKRSWIWHESWSDKNGQHTITTRYEVRDNGVYKVQNGGGYQRLTNNEAINLYKAAKLYTKRLSEDYNNSVKTA